MSSNKRNAENESANTAPGIVRFLGTESTIMFGSLLKERRKKAGISQKDLADLMNVTRNTIINWEADKSKPDYNCIPSLCAYLHIQLHELFHMRPQSGLTEVEQRIINNFRQLAPVSRKVIDKMISTMLQEEAIAQEKEMKETYGIFLQRPGTSAAGIGDYVPDEPPTFVFLRKNHINARADGIAKVNGDSMEPVYHDGDFIYYEDAYSAHSGEDVIVDTDDGAVIKRVDDDYTLYSVNQDIPYPKKNEQNTLIIRGRVLGVVSSSDRPTKEEESLLYDVFVDEIREFEEEHGVTY